MEKVGIHDLASAPVVIDRDGVPDFVATSMMKSGSTSNKSESWNILLSGVKRSATKEIVSFHLKIDEKEYSYPKDSCPEWRRMARIKAINRGFGYTVRKQCPQGTLPH